jgi:GST-like protein
MGEDYTIADISMIGWVRNLIGFYEARELVEFDTPAGSSAVSHGPPCSVVSRYPARPERGPTPRRPIRARRARAVRR